MPSLADEQLARDLALSLASELGHGELITINGRELKAVTGLRSLVSMELPGRLLESMHVVCLHDALGFTPSTGQHLTVNGKADWQVVACSVGPVVDMNLERVRT